MKKTKEINEYGQNISVRNANLWYGDFQAIKNISVEIPEKQVTAFIGPSGCGKSTFLKCFNRMNDLVDGCKIQGEFYVGETDIYGKIDVNEAYATAVVLIILVLGLNLLAELIAGKLNKKLQGDK